MRASKYGHCSHLPTSVETSQQVPYKSDLPLLPGALEAVHRVGERWPLALASSSPRELIDAVLDIGRLSGSFRAVISSDEVEHGKPAPDVYLRACDALGVPAATSVAVEDSTNGLRAALAAGLHVIAIPRPRIPPIRTW